MNLVKFYKNITEIEANIGKCEAQLLELNRALDLAKSTLKLVQSGVDVEEFSKGEALITLKPSPKFWSLPREDKEVLLTQVGKNISLGKDCCSTWLYAILRSNNAVEFMLRDSMPSYRELLLYAHTSKPELSESEQESVLYYLTHYLKVSKEA